MLKSQWRTTDAVTREPIRRVEPSLAWPFTPRTSAEAQVREEPALAWPFTPRTSAEAQAREEELLGLQQYVQTIVREAGSW